MIFEYFVFSTVYIQNLFSVVQPYGAPTHGPRPKDGSKPLGGRVYTRKALAGVKLCIASLDMHEQK